MDNPSILLNRKRSAGQSLNIVIDEENCWTVPQYCYRRREVLESPSILLYRKRSAGKVPQYCYIGREVLDSGGGGM